MKTDYIPIDPVLNSNCAAEDRVASNITLNIAVRIRVDRADSDGACEFYQDCVDGHFFVDNIPPQYISLCRNVITDINEMLLESGYDVYEIFSRNPMIRLRNLKNDEKIDLYYDGHYRSRIALSSELIDVLVKVHDMYWAKN